MNPLQFLSKDAPWFYLLVGPSKEAASIGGLLATAQPGVAGRVLHGAKMATPNALFNEFATALNFPDYFGRNWDALFDCLSDLHDGDAFILIIDDTPSVLSRDDAAFKTLINVLSDTAREWNHPESIGPADGIIKPFHVVFQCDATQESATRQRFAAAGLVR